jgi:hypothetical protein
MPFSNQPFKNSMARILLPEFALAKHVGPEKREV